MHTHPLYLCTAVGLGFVLSLARCGSHHH